MPSALVTIDIDADAEAVFDLVHDYDRRLDWDSFLREAILLHGHERADRGVVAHCKARRSVGGMSMDTVYVTFSRPRVAAVSMTRGPWLFQSFAASIRHDCIAPGRSRVSYRYRFTTRPRALAFLLEPLVQWVFRRETFQRLAALKHYVK